MRANGAATSPTSDTDPLMLAREPASAENPFALNWRSVSIGRKFGVFAVFLFVLLLGVCGVVIAHVGEIHADAARVLEETRERVLIARMASDARELEAELALLGEPGAEARRARASALIDDLELQVREIHESPEDPSLSEHNEEEERMTAQLWRDLAELRDRLGGSPSMAADETLGRLRHRIDLLDRETREEVAEAQEHLFERARWTRWLMIATVLVASIALWLSLGLAYRHVIRPLVRLRRTADRLAEGHLEHRAEIERMDEIGDVGRSLNQMAQRVQESHELLESRVEARTRDFLRAARLADLGIFAAGVAHEINTPLASIVTCTEGTQRRLRQGSPDVEDTLESLETIASEAYRAKEITTRMLALARQESGESHDLDLGETAAQLESALSSTARARSVDLRILAPRPSETVVGHFGELLQMLINVVGNAIDACEPGDSVSVEMAVHDGRLRLVVADTGSGISESDQEKVFEPFFTTKAPGRGTGLGLALTAALAESRGGTIHLESELGVGTTITIELPLAWRSA